MSADTRLIPAEALRSETVIKRAPAVTAGELLGNRIEDPKGIALNDAPIHSFRIERPGQAPEILALMPDIRMDGEEFLELLYAVSPYKVRNMGDLREHYKTMDRGEIEGYNKKLENRHKSMKSDWADFRNHFDLFRDTFFETPTDIVGSIMENGRSFTGEFEIGSLEIAGET